MARCLLQLTFSNCCQKFKLKLSFLSRQESNRLSASTPTSVLIYSDMIYMHVSSQCIDTLNTVSTGAYSKLHRTLYAGVGWSGIFMSQTKPLLHYYLEGISCLAPFLIHQINEKIVGRHCLRFIPAVCPESLH